MIFFVSLNGFAYRNTTIPNFNLVNQPSLEKILKAEVFVHIDGQLRAAYLILDYIPISKSFQAPKCVIKARDPHLHRISVTVPDFLTIGPIPKGTFTTIPIPEGIPRVVEPFQHVAKEEATSSQPATKEKKEEEDKEVVEVTNSEDNFTIFDQPLSPELQVGDSSHHPVQVHSLQEDTIVPKEMGIQHK